MSVEVPVPHPSAAAPAAPAATGPATADRAVAPVADFAPVFATTPAPGRTGATIADRPGSATGYWLAAVVPSLVLTAFAVLIISGRVVTEGPVVLVLSRTHGVHLGDLYVLAAWCAGVGTPVVRALHRFRSRTRTTSGGARPRRG